MTFDQVRWARTHDWFKEARLICGSYVVVAGDRYTTNVFTDYQKLRDWAGY